MAIVVIGGSGKNVGKTALVCGVIAALPEFAWTAVKITGHDYAPGASARTTQTVWEETRAGQETDTARYLAAGAHRALLVRRCGAEVPIQEIRRALGSDRHTIVESNRIVDVLRPDVCLALMEEGTARKASFLRMLRVADAVVTLGGDIADMPVGIRCFQLPALERLPLEMVEWMRERLGSAG